MAAFSSSSSSSIFQQHLHHPFILDSLFLPIPNTNTNTIHHSKNNHDLLLLHQSPAVADDHIDINNSTSFNNHQNLIHTTTTNTNGNDVIPKKHSMDHSSSIVTADKHDRKRKSTHGSSPNSAQSKDKRSEVKGKKQKKIKENDEEKKNNSKSKEDNSSNKLGYIHVRARRGQATDSHSLAERVRRERISERMKLLQTLVPGCDKVTGKALMLDEIINYVQSLQNQVEFLSMKLASVNPMFYDFGVDLESFMVRPDQHQQDLSELASPLAMAGMQESSPTNDYNFLPANNPILFQQITTLLPQPQPQPQQGSRQSLWEVDEHRQKINNQSGIGFNNNSLFSFH